MPSTQVTMQLVNTLYSTYMLSNTYNYFFILHKGFSIATFVTVFFCVQYD